MKADLPLILNRNVRKETKRYSGNWLWKNYSLICFKMQVGSETPISELRAAETKSEGFCSLSSCSILCLENLTAKLRGFSGRLETLPRDRISHYFLSRRRWKWWRHADCRCPRGFMLQDENSLALYESVKVWKWTCESESVKVKVWKWKCESVKVKVWEWKCESVKVNVWK